jgi:hypothetical protein
MTGTAGASNPQVRSQIGVSALVATSASRTLSRWRHGFKSRWDYQETRRSGAMSGGRGPSRFVLVPHLSRGRCERVESHPDSIHGWASAAASNYTGVSRDTQQSVDARPEAERGAQSCSAWARSLANGRGYVASHRTRLRCLGPKTGWRPACRPARDGAVSAGHLPPVQRRGTPQNRGVALRGENGESVGTLVRRPVCDFGSAFRIRSGRCFTQFHLIFDSSTRCLTPGARPAPLGIAALE